MEEESEAETLRPLSDAAQVKKAEPEFEPAIVWLWHSRRGFCADPGGDLKS